MLLLLVLSLSRTFGGWLYCGIGCIINLVLINPWWWVYWRQQNSCDLSFYIISACAWSNDQPVGQELFVIFFKYTVRTKYGLEWYSTPYPASNILREHAHVPLLLAIANQSTNRTALMSDNLLFSASQSSSTKTPNKKAICGQSGVEKGVNINGHKI